MGLHEGEGGLSKVHKKWVEQKRGEGKQIF